MTDQLLTFGRRPSLQSTKFNEEEPCYLFTKLVAGMLLMVR